MCSDLGVMCSGFMFECEAQVLTHSLFRIYLLQCREEVSSDTTTAIIVVSPNDKPNLWISKYSLLQNNANLHSVICLLSVLSREVYRELQESFSSLVKCLASDADKTVFGIVIIQVCPCFVCMCVHCSGV